MNAISFVIGHAVWSIGIPIAIIEMLTSSRRTEPWLSRPWLIATGLLYLLGCYIVFEDLRAREEGFLASPAQRISTAVVALALIVVALRIRTRPTPPPPAGFRTRGRWASVPSLCRACTSRADSWVGVVSTLTLSGLAALLVFVWSRREGWTVWHQFALVAGALPTYAWGGFVLTLLMQPDDPVRWIGNVAFALFAALLLVTTAKVVRRHAGQRRGVAA